MCPSSSRWRATGSSAWERRRGEPRRPCATSSASAQTWRPPTGMLAASSPGRRGHCQTRPSWGKASFPPGCGAAFRALLLVAAPSILCRHEVQTPLALSTTQVSDLAILWPSGFSCQNKARVEVSGQEVEAASSSGGGPGTGRALHWHPRCCGMSRPAGLRAPKAKGELPSALLSAP